MLLKFQTLYSHNFLFQNGVAIKVSRLVDNLFGFTTRLTESKYCISVLRHVSPNDMVYFIPHALFLQAWSHMDAGQMATCSSTVVAQMSCIFLTIN